MELQQKPKILTLNEARQRYILGEPLPRPRVGIAEVVREIPLATKRVAQGIGRFVKGVQEGIARSGASLGLTLTAPITGIREMPLEGTEWEKRIGRVIFGNRPIKAIETRIAEAELAVRDFSRKIRTDKLDEKIDIPVLSREWEKSLGKFSEENALALSILGVGATIGLDFTGTGGSKRAVKEIAKSKSPAFIARKLRQVNVAEDFIRPVSKRLAGITDEKEVARVLSKVNEIQSTSVALKEGINRGARKVSPVIKEFHQTLETPPLIRDIQLPKRVFSKVSDLSEIKITPRMKKEIDKMGIAYEDFAPAWWAQKRGTIPFPEIRARALKLNESLDDLLKIKPGDIKEPVVVERFQMLSRGLKAEVDKLKQNYIANPIPENKTIWEEAQRRLNDAKVKIEGIRSEYGRGLSAARIKDDLAISARNLWEARKKLTPEQQIVFDTSLGRIDLKDKVEVTRFIHQTQDAGFIEKLVEYYKNSLLSAPITHIRNTVGNTMFYLFDIPVKAFAGGLDSVLSKIIPGRTRTVYPKEALEMIYGGLKAVPDAVIEAMRQLRDEFYIFGVRGQVGRQVLEAGRMVPAIKGRFGQIVRMPFRFLGAMDLFNKKIRITAETDAFAYKLAKAKGLKGVKLVEEIEKIKRNPTADMIDLVTKKAERGLFLEEFEGILKGVEEFRNRYPATQFVIPFYRTPINLVREAYRMTPLRVISLLGKKKDPWLLNPNTRMEEISRMILGSLIGGTIVHKMLDGTIDITGTPPKDRAERDLFYRLGKQPYSIRIGDKWYSYREIHPFSTIAFGAAQIGEMINLYRRRGELPVKEINERANRLISDTALYLQDLTFFQALANVMEVFTGGIFGQGHLVAGENYLGQLMGGFIPNILFSYQRAADPTIYSTRGFLDRAVKVRVPGMQEALMPRRDIYGRPMERPGGFLINFLSPIKVSQERRDLVDEELERLEIAIGYPTRTAFGEPLTDYEYDAFLQDSGARIYEGLTRLIRSRDWQETPTHEKLNLIQRVVENARNQTRESLFGYKKTISAIRDSLEKQEYTEAQIENLIEERLQTPGEAERLLPFLVTPQPEAKPMTLEEARGKFIKPFIQP